MSTIENDNDFNNRDNTPVNLGEVSEFDQIKQELQSQILMK